MVREMFDAVVAYRRSPILPSRSRTIRAPLVRPPVKGEGRRPCAQYRFPFRRARISPAASGQGSKYAAENSGECEVFSASRRGEGRGKRNAFVERIVVRGEGENRGEMVRRYRLLTWHCRGRAGLGRVGHRGWGPEFMMRIVVIGDEAQAEARHETANHNPCHPLSRQLLILPHR